MPKELQVRTRRFAIDVLRFIRKLPCTIDGRVIAWQLAKAGSAVGSNYRRVCLAQSDRDFIAKLKVVEEETDESCFWLEVCLELGFGDQCEAGRLNGESGELKAMVVSSIQTKRSRLRVR
jgi:four helix bundle protein